MSDLKLNAEDEVLLESLVLAASDNVARAPASDRDQFAPERRRAFVETSGDENVYLGTGDAWVEVSNATGLVSSLFQGGDLDVANVTSDSVNTDEVSNKDYNESVDVHAGVSGTVTLDLSVANVHHVEATGDVTLEFANATAGTGNSLLVYLVDDDGTGPHTISWPASVVWSDGDTVAEIPADGDVEVSLLSGDGSEWRGRESGRQFA